MDKPYTYYIDTIENTIHKFIELIKTIDEPYTLSSEETAP